MSGAGVDFSELYKQSSGLCFWSPDGKLVAVAVAHRLVVRDVETLQILSLYSCVDAIEHVEWSCDSVHVLCAMYKRGVVQVWSVRDPEWTCKITEGLAGMVHARWSPDGRHILTTSDFQLHVTIWSLLSRAMYYVRNPKAGRGTLAFSADGKFMAVATRAECKDELSVYFCDTWELVRQFPIASKDAAAVAWAPDGSSIAVRDSPLDYRCLVYSPDGRLQVQYEAYELALGLKAAEWAPSGDFLALGSYDQRLRLLNSLTWRPLGEFAHASPVASGGTVVYREVYTCSDAQAAAASDAASLDTRFEVQELPAAVEEVRPDPSKPNPKLGVGLVAWSPDGAFVATRNDNMPTALWVWDVAKLRLASVVVTKSAVRSVQWDPSSAGAASRLALCTGTSKVYLWAPTGASWVDVPADKFGVKGLRWSPSGGRLLLHSSDSFCVVYC